MSCPICESGMSDECAFRLGVCDPCAERIANRWWDWHAGAYLTWPRDAERVEAYRKKPIPQTLRTQVFERDMYRCVSCCTHLDLTVDHVLAESRGGEAVLSNLQTLCRSCNSRKGAR